MDSRIIELKPMKLMQSQIFSEIELLVGKYLKQIEELGEGLDFFEKIPVSIKNVMTYWKRLMTLFSLIEDEETRRMAERSFRQAIVNELQQLERLYAALNQRIQFFEKNWTEAMWESAHLVLLRMDELLASEKKDSTHKDRLCIQKLLLENDIKKRQSFLSLKREFA